MPQTATKRRTQAERKAESERRIIRAARELFARQGYMRTTLIEVGQSAGYTGGLVTHRFGSKEGLLNAVVDNSARRFAEEQVRPAVEGKTATKADRIALGYIAECDQRVKTVGAVGTVGAIRAVRSVETVITFTRR